MAGYTWEEIYRRNADMVYRICVSYLKNREDAADAQQTTFYKMIISGKVFESVEHEKAWLIVTASNVCKNHLKHWWRKTAPLHENMGFSKDSYEVDNELLRLIWSLPQKYRISIYLHYYEGYNSEEIGKMLKKSDATIRGYLKKAREILKSEMGWENE